MKTDGEFMIKDISKRGERTENGRLLRYSVWQRVRGLFERTVYVEIRKCCTAEEAEKAMERCVKKSQARQ